MSPPPSFEATSKLESLYHEALSTFLTGLVEINSSFTQMNTMLEATTRKRQDFCADQQSASWLAISLLAFFGFVVVLGYLNVNFKSIKSHAIRWFTSFNRQVALVLNQEMIREWETLFRRAKRFDALLAKQQVLQKDRCRGSKRRRKAVVDDSVEEIKQNCYGGESASEQDVFVEAIEDSNPRFVSAVEMLEIKHDLYDDGESYF